LPFVSSNPFYSCLSSNEEEEKEAAADDDDNDGEEKKEMKCMLHTFVPTSVNVF